MTDEPHPRTGAARPSPEEFPTLTGAAQEAPGVAEELAGVGEFPPGASDAEKLTCLGSWVRLLAEILLDQQRSIDRMKQAAAAEAAALARVCQTMDLQSRVVAEVASLATGIDFEEPGRGVAEAPDPSAGGS